MQAWEYFIFGCMGQSGSAWVYAFDRLMVQHWCLKCFSDSKTLHLPLIMTSLFILQFFLDIATDWDSQYLSWEEVYCAITAPDGYPSHSDNIHYIRSATLIYALPPSTDYTITSILDTPYISLLLPADICLCPGRATRATSSAHL